MAMCVRKGHGGMRQRSRHLPLSLDINSKKKTTAYLASSGVGAVPAPQRLLVSRRTVIIPPPELATWSSDLLRLLGARSRPFFLGHKHMYVKRN